MRFSQIFERLGLTSRVVPGTVADRARAAVGFALMPVLIFYAGFFAPRTLRGREPAAHLTKPSTAASRQASVASWIVLLGPYGLYLLFKGAAGLVARQREAGCNPRRNPYSALSYVQRGR